MNGAEEYVIASLATNPAHLSFILGSQQFLLTTHKQTWRRTEPVRKASFQGRSSEGVLYWVRQGSSALRREGKLLWVLRLRPSHFTSFPCITDIKWDAGKTVQFGATVKAFVGTYDDDEGGVTAREIAVEFDADGNCIPIQFRDTIDGYLALTMFTDINDSYNVTDTTFDVPDECKFLPRVGAKAVIPILGFLW